MEMGHGCDKIIFSKQLKMSARKYGSPIWGESGMWARDSTSVHPVTSKILTVNL